MKSSQDIHTSILYSLMIEVLLDHKTLENLSSFRENLSKSKWKWWITAIIANLILLIILFFFTTPLIIINSLNELEYLKPIQEHVSTCTKLHIQCIFLLSSKKIIVELKPHEDHANFIHSTRVNSHNFCCCYFQFKQRE